MLLLCVRLVNQLKFLVASFLCPRQSAIVACQGLLNILILACLHPEVDCQSLHRVLSAHGHTITVKIVMWGIRQTRVMFTPMYYNCKQR